MEIRFETETQQPMLVKTIIRDKEGKGLVVINKSLEQLGVKVELFREMYIVKKLE